MYNKNVYKYDDMKRAEHNAVRQTVGWYYFTHQLLEVTGSDSTTLLDLVMTNPITNLKIGSARYSTMLNEAAEIIDDVVLFRLEENKYWVSTLFVTKMIQWFDVHKGEMDVSYQNVTKSYDMYAVQGPRSKDVINALATASVDDQKFFTIRDNAIGDIPVKISRAGFTGEKFGYEIYVAPEYDSVIEEKLHAVSASMGGRQVTDFQIMAMTLPCEKGFYYMRDLMHTNPFEVGLDRGIGWDKEFIGKAALLKIHENGPTREMLGFVVDEDDVFINHKCFGGCGDAVMFNNEEVGRVSKFTYSYVLEKNIGYILADKGVLNIGDHVEIHGYDAVIAKKPFI